MVDYQTLSIVLTGIGMIIALTYYSLQIRNQNKTRQAQLIMQLYSRLDTLEKSRAFLHLLTWEFSDFEEFLQICDPLSMSEEAVILNNFMITFEGIAAMVKQGFIDLHQIATFMGGGFILYWSKFEPIKEDIREYMKYPRWASETEYLYKELKKYQETHPEFKT